MPASDPPSMMLDARSLPDRETLEATVAIVGGGAAGITLARELSGSDAEILLIESGGLDYEAATQDLYGGEIVGHDYFPPTVTRLRYFGGSTNHWDGLCRPLDPIDFEARPGIPDSGWPFPATALDPYYRRAQAICQLGPFDYAAEAWRRGGIGAFDLPDRGIRSAVFQCSPPTRFAAAYGPELTRARNVRVLLDANLVEIALSADGNRVSGLRLATLDGKRSEVRARHFVLACGGIENPRLLLNSTAQQPAGIGNGHDLVGRYFMDHPKIWKGGLVVFGAARPELGFYDYHDGGGTRIQGVFVPTEEVMRAEGLANFTICLDGGSIADLSAGAAAARHLRRNLLHGEGWRDIAEDLGRVVGDIDGLAGALYRKARGAAGTLFSTRYWCDCPPDRDSRITLSEERDALGQRRVRIDWRLPADFAHNFRRAHELLGAALGEAGLGRVRINSAADVGDPIAAVENSHHHMGTTRMHRDPRHGVVDPDCRVHGLANLSIAGSSVFPTYGQANPTLTIVALAVRLADHLKSTLA